MGVRQRILAAALAACASLGALSGLPAHAFASPTQQSILMDDDELIYASPDHVVSRLEQLAALGVDRVKVSVVWSLVAPDSESTHRPAFNATDPSQYPPGAWDRYDLMVREARALGLKVYFQLDPRAPVWAQPPGQPVQGPVLSRAPRASEFRQFVEAVGRRYNGSYAISTTQTEPAPTLLGVPTGDAQSTTVTSDAIPRVSYWGIWNEPNERSWLSPIKRKLGPHRTEYLQPLIYRRLVNAAWAGLTGSGHRSDTILIGETANVGILQPITFVRGLYCVSPSLRPLHGRDAAEFGCPASGDAAAFARGNPGLFGITGFAHHPYLFDAPPDRRGGKPNTITLATLGSFEGTLKRIFATYGHPRAVIPLYMTEWGYKTSPPNPFVHTTLAEQAAWINQGEYMTWRDPYVNALAQFELVDSPPKAGTTRGSPSYWSSFQTGLLFHNGRSKPSLAAFRVPIWLPVARHGASVTVWGQLRPVDHTSRQYGVIEFRPQGRAAWTTVRVVQTDSPEGFVLAHVPLPGPGRVRLSLIQMGTGDQYDSREVSVS